MKSAHQPGKRSQSFVRLHPGWIRRNGHGSLDELEPLPTIGIGPERHRSTREAGRGKRGQEPMNRSRMWIRRPTDFCAHSYDRTCVRHPARQNFLCHPHRMPDVMAATWAAATFRREATTRAPDLPRGARGRAASRRCRPAWRARLRVDRALRLRGRGAEPRWRHPGRRRCRCRR